MKLFCCEAVAEDLQRQPLGSSRGSIMAAAEPCTSLYFADLWL